MYDVAIELDDRAGALADMGEALGQAGVSVEGGGVFVANGVGVAHFLFADGDAARNALERAGIRVKSVNEVVALRLRQDQPGQLGKISRSMADAGVNILVQYSDHDGQLILVVDNLERGQAIAREWTQK
jgi:hypothetical protein